MKYTFALLFTVLALFNLGNSTYQNDPQEDQYYSRITEIIKNAVKDPRGKIHHSSFERLAEIVDTFGPRLWGGKQLEMVIDDLIKQAGKYDFDRVYRDPVTNFTKWVRNEELLTLHDPRPFPQNIKMIGLGRSISGDVKAEVLVVTSFEDLELKKEQVKGKIVCYSMKYVSYGETVIYRSQGASMAAKHGAVGVVMRSITPFSIDSPHTGAMTYDERYPKVPAAAISIADANMFLRMANRGQKIVLHLQMKNQFVPGQNSSNVIAEIRGSEFPDEIILFGGHMDSWDTGSQTGANDDGGGFITCFEALRVLADLNLRPKRTLRFIGWSGEEYGGDESGAAQYARNHKDELDNHVLVFESDEGSTTPYGYGFSGNATATEMMGHIVETNFKAINCTYMDHDGVMVDSGWLYEQGVPNMRNLIQDFNDKTHPYYFTYHHSAGDSMEVMDPDMMDDNVIMIASMMYNIANRNERLPRTNFKQQQQSQQNKEKDFLQ